MIDVLVGFGYLAVTVTVDKLTFDGVAVNIVNLLVNVEAVSGVSHHVGLDVGTCTGRDATGSNEVTGIVTVGKLGDLVLVPGDVEVGCPCEVTCHDRTSVDVELDTGVLKVTDVGVHCIGQVRSCGNGGPGQQVLGLALVDLKVTCDAVVEESEVDTEVPCGCFLPLDVGVVTVRLDNIDESALSVGDDVGIGSGVGSRVTVVTYCIDRHAGEEVVAYILLTGDTPAGTDLKVAEHAACGFHEGFVDYTPCKRNRRECTPAMILGET